MDRSDSSVDVLLGELTSSIHRLLGDGLVGAYLYGSYVSGGFDPGVSDLDLLVVTSSAVEGIDLAGLEEVHREFVDRHPDWIDRIEVVYIGRAVLKAFRTSVGHLAVISPGEPFHVRDDQVDEWLQNWYLVRETGITLYGPPPAAVLPPVAWTEFVAATERYAGQVSAQDFGGLGLGQLAYSILTMCRALRTVETQTQGSKQEAAAWARERLPKSAWLIDAALRSRLSRGTLGFEDERTRAAAREFIGRVAAMIRLAPTAR